MTHGKKASKVFQLAGPGVEGKENEPPLFHVDIPNEHVATFMADPAAFLAERGVGPDQGIAVDGSMAVTVPAGKWDGTKWVEPSAGSLISVGYCCYTTSTQSVCHQHVHVE